MAGIMTENLHFHEIYFMSVLSRADRFLGTAKMLEPGILYDERPTEHIQSWLSCRFLVAFTNCFNIQKAMTFSIIWR
jgi:hypothetical protein